MPHHRTADPVGKQKIGVFRQMLSTSEINASISRIWDGGFRVTLGEPKRAEGWAFPSIGAAVEWLRDQAVAHYPESEFARKYAGFGDSL
jgi:hypothetical protein